MSTTILLQATQRSKTGRAALAYVERFGWAGLPVHSVKDGLCTCGKPDCSNPGKHPLTRNGVRDASKDPATIARWWHRWPWANVGIATGAVSAFFVLDIDGEQGAESLRELEQKNGKLPETVEQLTGGGGRHILFRQPDFTVANKVRLASGIDIRGDGGYIVAAPSGHISGRAYNWELSSRPGEVEIADAPEWVLAMLRPARDAGQRKPSGEWQRIACTDAPEGERNERLAKITGHLLRKYVDPFLTSELVQAWNAARCLPPLSVTEVEKILESLAAKELRRRGCKIGEQ